MWQAFSRKSCKKLTKKNSDLKKSNQKKEKQTIYQMERI